jgi:hypothetical protein
METTHYYTPDKITELLHDQVFVFGSNKEGNHAGGAAAVAVEKFGAVMGHGEGLQGRSYAIPTMDTIGDLGLAVARFIDFAGQHPELLFYVTKIGTGIAGHPEKSVKALFGSMVPGNVRLPKEWDERRYKFLLLDNDRVGSMHGKMDWKLDKWQRVAGDIKACNNGFHCSLRMLDALNYVKGGLVARVEVAGGCDLESDKQSWRRMRLVDMRIWRPEDSVSLSIYAAESVINLYEKQYPKDDRPRKAIEAAKAYLADPTQERARAAYAAGAAAYAAARAAYAAGAARAAAYAADAAYAAGAARAAAYAARAAYAAGAARAAAYAADAAYAAYAAALDTIGVWLERRFDQLPKHQAGVK